MVLDLGMPGKRDSGIPRRGHSMGKGMDRKIGAPYAFGELWETRYDRRFIDYSMVGSISQSKLWTSPQMIL